MNMAGTLAASALMYAGMDFGSQPAREVEKFPIQDVERINKAQEKRDRKAALRLKHQRSL